ncbi:ABC transporter permease [Nocardia sp. NPDC024068]|uniref:ABC transporter permease n=1 Tax=Nocardia sp. NPDC024068 TaxID=3157197 RepID=UPI0033D912B7
MTTATRTAPVAATPAVGGTEVDNRPAYIGFGLGYILGHGAAALSRGEHPLVELPAWLPLTLLGIGLATGTVCATLAAVRAQRGAGAHELLSGKLLGLSWIVGFGALFLAITGLTGITGMQDLPALLWPAGSGLIVGLIYLGEGAVRRNVLHYALGAWLAFVSTVALAVGDSGLFWVLAVAGGAGYALAAGLEWRRLA